MQSSITLLFVIALGALTLIFTRSWHSTLVLAIVEVAWVALCTTYGCQFFVTGEAYLLFWACVMLFFSAIELAVSSVLFLIENSNSNLSEKDSSSKV